MSGWLSKICQQISVNRIKMIDFLAFWLIIGQKIVIPCNKTFFDCFGNVPKFDSTITKVPKSYISCLLVVELLWACGSHQGHVL